MISAKSTVVVLVTPENPLNIGFVARAMRCNGVEELRICCSHWKEMPDEAHRTGASAPEILERALFFHSLEEALGDSVRAIAFSRRRFDLALPHHTLGEWKAPHFDEERTALVFGRESNGLTREELLRCSALCSIPVVEGVSYNLGMAVAIALHELVQKEEHFSPRSREAKELPLLSEQEALFHWIEEKIEAGDLRGDQRRAIRQLVQRMEPSRNELRTLFALFKSINGEK